MRRQGTAGLAMGVVALVVSRVCALDPEPVTDPLITGAAPAGEVAVATAMAASVRSHLAAERSSANRSLWGWSVIGIGSGVYAGLALAGSAGGGPATESVAWVGAVAGVVGVARALMRTREVTRLDRRLGSDVDRAAGSPAVPLGSETQAAIDRELRSRLTALRSSARGALRAGCVLPVLLAGIGAYGVSSGGAGGDALAGLGIGGALVIGAPSMLSYVGLQGRLARMEDLVARWDRALAGGR